MDISDLVADIEEQFVNLHDLLWAIENSDGRPDFTEINRVILDLEDAVESLLLELVREDLE